MGPGEGVRSGHLRPFAFLLEPLERRAELARVALGVRPGPCLVLSLGSTPGMTPVSLCGCCLCAWLCISKPSTVGPGLTQRLRHPRPVLYSHPCLLPPAPVNPADDGSWFRPSLGGPGGLPGSWFGLSPALTVDNIRGVNKWVCVSQVWKKHCDVGGVLSS